MGTTSSTQKLILTAHDKAISLIFQPGDTYTFDPSGRPVGFYIEGRYFARGLDGKLKEKSWGQAQDIFDRDISEVSAADRDRVYRCLKAAVSLAMKNRSTLQFRHTDAHSTSTDKKGLTVDQTLEKLASWTPERQKQEESTFQTIYQSISILPPDQYFCVPLQVVQGCPWNQCTFCDFYRDRRFRVRSLPDTFQHMKHVKTFIGDGLPLRRTLFLCDANALVSPHDHLMQVMEESGRQFPDQAGPEGGIYTFADVPAILRKTENELKELREKGLRRVYIGMETGSDKLRQLIRKPAQKKNVIEAVHRLKQAGLETGLIILLGIGGEDHQEDHVTESLEALCQMKLSRGDIVYFSPYYPESGVDLTPESQHPLQKNQIRDQYHQFQQGLIRAQPETGPIIGVYDIREFMV